MVGKCWERVGYLLGDKFDEVGWFLVRLGYLLESGCEIMREVWWDWGFVEVGW